MKRNLLLLTIVMLALHASAALVDVATAQRKAQEYLVKEVYTGKFVAPSATAATLIKTEMGDVNSTTPVYYIFNTATTFVIVSGDDRAEDILAFGDKPLNLDRMPENMKAWLEGYKHEIDYLISNPDLKVEKPSEAKNSVMKTIDNVSPLLTAMWDQDAPYWNQCKFTYNGSTYQCYTGCPATSASMVMYYWKWPTAQVAAIPSYTGTLELSSSRSVTFTYPALSATTFDWANMKDTYNSYTTAQGNAVATLMRYVGQAEKMMYGTASAGGSGIYTTDTQNIVDMYVRFGYDETTCRVAKKSSYSASNWETLLQNELAAGRPVVYMAVSSYAGGHAFNVDGYRASDNKYHINWGWSGDGNTYCAMNAFNDGSYTFNQDQQMVIGIKPKSTGPTITASVSSLDMSCSAAATASKTFTVTGSNLTNQVNITLTDANGVFSVTPANVSVNDATNGGKTVTVTFTPNAAGTFTGNVKLSSNGASDVNIPINATATKVSTSAPVLGNASNVTSSSFTASWTHSTTVDMTYTLNVTTSAGAEVANVTGITAKNYTVTGLTAGAAYIFKVKAVPVNTNVYAESNWSSVKNVTLLENVEPVITVNPASLDFGAQKVGQTSTMTFNVTGASLQGSISLSVNDADNVYSVNVTSISSNQATTTGRNVVVTFAPKENKTYNASITLTSANAQTVTVTLTGAGAYDAPVMAAADENFIKHTSFRADWSDATPTDKVASYTLEVSYVAPEPPTPDLILLDQFDMSALTAVVSEDGYLTNVASNYADYLPEGWTVGSPLYVGDGFVLVREQTSSNLSNCLTTPSFTLPEGCDKVTVVVTAAGYDNNNITTGLTVSTVNGGSSQTASFDELSTWYNCVYVLDASSTDQVRFNPYTTSAQYYAYAYIGDIKIYAGDVSDQLNAESTNLKAVSETGDATYRLIEGITDLNYVVENLTAGGTFTYRVKAVYTNGTESEWSNVETVTLREEEDPVEYLRGDVNLSGSVDIDDVNIVIAIILGKDQAENYGRQAYVTDDDNIDVDDVNEIVQIILGKAPANYKAKKVGKLNSFKLIEPIDMTKK